MKNTEKQQEATLVEQIISKELERDSGKRSSLNLALFLANKEEIGAAVAAGLNSKIIWKTLRDNKKFIGGYETFRRYVRRYIKQQDNVPDKQKDQKNVPQPSTVEATSLSNFTYSPEPNPEKLF